MASNLVFKNEETARRTLTDSFNLLCNQTRFSNNLVYTFQKIELMLGKVIESNGDVNLINKLQIIINDNILRYKTLIQHSHELKFSMNSLNYGKSFLEFLLLSNNSLSSMIVDPTISEDNQFRTNEEIINFMTLILERLHMLYNDLLTDNFKPLTDEAIRNLFHHAHQSFAAFVPLIKLITLELEKNVTATNGNIETYQAMLNEKFKESFPIMKDMIDQSTTSYKEELQYAINAAIQFNENVGASINFALTTFQSMMIPIDDPRSSQFREIQNNIIMFAINEYNTQIKELSMSANIWETDEFPMKIAQSQNAMITNVETQLVNKVIVEMGKLEAKFSKNYNNMVALHTQLFERIAEQETIIGSHLNQFRNIPEKYKEKMDYAINQAVDIIQSSNVTILVKLICY
jgi:hypothetical protein